MNNKPQQPSQATRLQLQLNLNTLLTNYLNKEIHSLEAQCHISFWDNNPISHLTGLATPGSEGPRGHAPIPPHPLFPQQKQKKETKEKSVSREKLLKDCQ